MKLSLTQLRVLRLASTRPGNPVCPTPGLHAAVQTAVLRSLEKRGLITSGGIPVLTELGKKIATSDILLQGNFELRN